MNELEKLRAQQKAIENRIAQLENVPVRKNDLGFYAIRTCKNSLENILLLAKNIDLDNDSEIEITKAFEQINKASWTAIKGIERDAAERGD